VFSRNVTVRRTDHVHGATDAVAVDVGNGKCHVTAIAASLHHDPIGVEIRPGPDPVEQRANVSIGPLAQEAVVEQRERLAVAGRAAHVGKEDGYSELV